MPNSLIYSPCFDGHRQVYALVMATVLRELGFKINIAWDPKQVINNTFYLDRIKDIPDITFIDTNKYDRGGNGIAFEEFIRLQTEYKIDLTIFAEADIHIPLFATKMVQKKYRFRGRMVAVFMRPFHFYRNMSFLNTLKFIKHFPSRWKKDERFFYEFILNRLSIFDEALCIDENFVSHQKKITWLPDVFQQYAELIAPDEKKEQQEWIGKLDDFIDRNNNNFPFFYFGTAQARRGYDILLKMAVENDGCFIHCGLRSENEKFAGDSDKLRLSLQQKGKLFETNEYIVDPITIKHFFISAKRMIFPYRKFYGSSGVMLQALEYGIPVLSPSTGIMGSRVSKYGLGIVYEEENETDKEKKFELFKLQDHKLYEVNIKKYMSFQSVDQLKKTLINAFTGAKWPVRFPYINSYDRTT
jgi:hypothetical protein